MQITFKNNLEGVANRYCSTRLHYKKTVSSDFDSLSRDVL